MTHRDEDALWRSIIENYGDRAELDEDPHPTTRPENEAGEPGPSAGSAGPFAEFDRSDDFRDDFRDELGDDPDADPDPVGFVELSGSIDEPRFVPPTPPPLPRTTPLRRAAWLGVIGSPILFLLTAFTGGALGGTVALVLSGVFVGSLVYLVLTMPQEPREPWDNGARV